MSILRTTPLSRGLSRKCLELNSTRRPHTSTNHCCLCREGNQYYVFGTDTGYRTPPFLQFKCSPDLINFKFCGHVFAAWPAWVRTAIPGATNIWAPDVSFSPTQQRWNLYYAVSTFGSQSSVIGLASTPTLDPTNASYAWRDDGLVMQSSNKLDYNAIDPSLFYDASGAAWLTLGSFWTGIKVLPLYSDICAPLRKN